MDVAYEINEPSLEKKRAKARDVGVNGSIVPKVSKPKKTSLTTLMVSESWPRANLVRVSSSPATYCWKVNRNKLFVKYAVKKSNTYFHDEISDLSGVRHAQP